MQVFVNGLVTGLSIALIALSLALVYLPTRVFHLALAGVVSATPLAWLALDRWGVARPLAAVLALGLACALSLGCELLNHGPLARREAGPAAHLVASLGLATMLVQALVVLTGNQQQALTVGADGLRIGSVVLSESQLARGAVSLIGLTAAYVWLLQSTVGLQLRALADNPSEMAARGYRVTRKRRVAFAVSGLLAGVASLGIAWDIGCDPNGGFPLLMLGVGALLVGGREAWLGPVVGGLLFGFVRSYSAAWLSGRWEDAASYGLLVVFLLFRPDGLLRGAAQRTHQP